MSWFPIADIGGMSNVGRFMSLDTTYEPMFKEGRAPKAHMLQELNTFMETRNRPEYLKQAMHGVFMKDGWNQSDVNYILFTLETMTIEVLLTMGGFGLYGLKKWMTSQHFREMTEGPIDYVGEKWGGRYAKKRIGDFVEGNSTLYRYTAREKLFTKRLGYHQPIVGGTPRKSAADILDEVSDYAPPKRSAYTARQVTAAGIQAEKWDTRLSLDVGLRDLRPDLNWDQLERIKDECAPWKTVEECKGQDVIDELAINFGWFWNQFEKKKRRRYAV